MKLVFLKFFFKNFKYINISENNIAVFLKLSNENKKSIKKIFWSIKLTQFLKQILLVDIITYNNIINSKIFVTIYVFKQLPDNFSIYLVVKNTNELPSLNTIFFNSIWFERENKEFFNIKFINNIDHRNLLLTYTNMEFPLIKSYPTSGFKEIFYNNITNSINYSNITIQI